MSWRNLQPYVLRLILLACLSWAVAGGPTPLQRRRDVAREAQSTTTTEQSSNSPSQAFRKQFTNPAEVLSVLLIIGGDVVQKAVAQLSGWPITPVSFSFGWVAYAFGSLMSACGDGNMMPEPDFPSHVVTLRSRAIKRNESWVLGRLIRDLEAENDKAFDKWTKDDGEDNSGLLITVYDAMPREPRPMRDLLWWSFLFVLPLQLIVAIIPVIVHRNWSIILVTASGSILALVTGSMPEWREEKFKCRKAAKDTYIIMRGNGHPQAFVIRPHEDRSSLILDDLANAAKQADRKTRIASFVLAALWILHLITVGGLDSDSWYLFGVGAIGMIHTVVVAGMKRNSAAHGIPVSLAKTGKEKLGRRKKPKEGEQDPGRPKVMDTLFNAETAYPGLGFALRPHFFNGILYPEEVLRWDELERTLEERRHLA